MKSILKNVALSSLLSTSAVMAQADSGASEEKWDFALAPLYLWSTGMSGSSTMGDKTSPINIEFKDALDNMDSAFTIHFEANKGKWGILADYMHIGLAPEAEMDGQSVAIDVTNNIYEVAGIHRPGEQEDLELLFGGRWLDFKQGVDMGEGKNTLVDDSWFDAYLGARYIWNVSKNGKFMFRGDVGAGESNLVWNSSILFDYRVHDNISLLTGYRWLDYDYDKGEGDDYFSYDVRYEGPVFAANFNW